jgi:aminoglycoside/choline kinase family phosphotransferase/dTDP-glucose pyrophosphorylase
MKALVLCAGFGTRLRPYTLHTPKPLFVLGDKTILDHTIQRLIDAHCTEIMVNTHHLPDAIEEHVRGRNYGIQVRTIHEPDILGTGGAIQNLKHFWDDEPFFVVNGDIYTDLDLRAIHRHHLSHPHLATLALVDHHELNTVPFTPSGLIAGFKPEENYTEEKIQAVFTFTGIQVLDPKVLQFSPANRFFSSIDIYRNVLAAGLSISAWIPERCYWTDIGTPERYRQAAIEMLTQTIAQEPLISNPIQGDGSDRRWYRMVGSNRSFILADHGIRQSAINNQPRQKEPCQNEVDAFIDIGSHLKKRGVNVPTIMGSNRFAGLVLLEDLGTENLQTVYRSLSSVEEQEALYQKTIEALIRMDITAAQGFDTSWTCQTRMYDQKFILAYECNYFLSAFIEGYLHKKVDSQHLHTEFENLALGAVSQGFQGFMHRDLQSRNIMIKNGEPYFIDFQGGRLGPIQYDLASLLIDPYTLLPVDLQERQLMFALECLKQYRDMSGNINETRFVTGFHFCRVTRNLQMLGAFGFLTTKKKKVWFEQYIPSALERLKRHIKALPRESCPFLIDLAESLVASPLQKRDMI